MIFKKKKFASIIGKCLMLRYYILNSWSTNLVCAFCPFWEKHHLKTRDFVPDNGGFQIHMQFSLSKSNDGINRLVHQLGNVSMFHIQKISSKCHLASLCSKHSIYFCKLVIIIIYEFFASHQFEVFDFKLCELLYTFSSWYWCVGIHHWNLCTIQA